MTNLFTLSLQRNRDLLVARLRLRQITGMLGFDLLEQSKIAAVAFEMACRRLETEKTVDMQVVLEDKSLIVCFGEASELARKNPFEIRRPRIVVSVPPDAERMTEDDLVWSIGQLEALDKPNLLAEIRQHNSDLICVMTLLQQSENANVKPAMRIDAA